VSELDRRLNAFRPDMADVRLKGRVAAAHFVAGSPRTVVAGNAPLKSQPASDAPLASEVLRGETFVVFDDGAEGWSWGQLETDGYVGYVPSDALESSSPAATHRVTALRTFVYPGPDMKLPALGALPLSARIALAGEAITRGTRYALLADGEGAIVANQAVPLAMSPVTDFIAVAERFLNAPYLWGGRTSAGLDCSALVQLSLGEAGIAAPRDTDLQERALGHAVDGSVEAPLRRGDLVFWIGHWAGHVGIMIDGEYLLHANGHHMAVVIEPLAVVTERIAGKTRQPTSVRRL
jgi:cell wall-associated NlpC family hydrolase